MHKRSLYPWQIALHVAKQLDWAIIKLNNKEVNGL